MTLAKEPVKTTVAPLEPLQRLRSYSRRTPANKRETWDETCDRTLYSPHLGLKVLGKFTDEEMALIDEMQRKKIAFGSARWLWVGGTEWIEKPENYPGAYNCSSFRITDIDSIGYLMDLAMQGTGTGAVVELDAISQLPPIRNKIWVRNINVHEDEKLPKSDRLESTTIEVSEDSSIVNIRVGDSRQGWVSAYKSLIRIATEVFFPEDIQVFVDHASVRPKGEQLKGFGGVANPVRLPETFVNCAKILNKAFGRKLNSVEVCLYIGEGAAAVVAGNLRRSAGMRQGSAGDKYFAASKDNLWTCDEQGNWRIDPERDSLRTANHTRVFHRKPTLKECVDSVRKQFYSGEGAIQYAPEAIARANADLLDTLDKKSRFIDWYSDPNKSSRSYLEFLINESGRDITANVDQEINHRMQRYGLNPCFRGDMRLLTTDGYKRFDELDGTNPLIINADGNVSQSKVWCSGEKETVSLSLTTRQKFVCTPDHRLMTTDGEFEAKDCTGKKLKPYLKSPSHDPLMVACGFIQGDGQLSRLASPSHLGIEANVGAKDKDIMRTFGSLEPEGVSYKWSGDRQIYVRGLKPVLIELGFSTQILPDRVLPESYENWTPEEKMAFLNGLYSANGSVLQGGRITLKTTCPTLVTELIKALSEFGIKAYCTTNKSKVVEFANGSYECRESYDVNIQDYFSRLQFFNLIGFSLDYKTERLRTSLIENAPRVRKVHSDEIVKVYDFTEPLTHWGVVEGFVAHNCGEIISTDFFCNLSSVHLNQIDPFDFEVQEKAFTASALQAAAFLNRGFTNPRYQYSRDLDPIVGVSFTGAFTFFVNAFGADWLKWWKEGRPLSSDCIRPETLDFWFEVMPEPLQKILYDWDWHHGYLFQAIEQYYFTRWRSLVHETVWEYCDRHGLKHPNRCTTLKPEGSLTLLTGVGACGWHPPKAKHYIRRMTFGAHDPIALAAIDYGYTVVPSQSCKDENGNLLNDPFDPRVTEWLVEVPVEEPWANLPGAEDIDPSAFPVEAQFDFYMQVQKYYTTHNTSATIEIYEHEIEKLAGLIHNAIANDEGYISAAVMGRSDGNNTFPRLPFEPVSRERYQELVKQVSDRRQNDDFMALISKYETEIEAGPADSACDSGACLLK